MRILLTLIFVSIQSFNLYADAGSAFRYKVELQYENRKEIGYIYHNTFSDAYKKEKESFFDYFTRNFNNKPYLYKEIHSLNLDEKFELDFYLLENRIEFNLKKVTTIKLLKEKELNVGGNIFLIESKNVYNLIGKESFNKEHIYYPEMENCSFFIIAFNKEKNITKTKITLDSLIRKYFNKETQIIGKKFYTNYNKVKKQLLNDNILVFQYCDAL